MSDANSARLAAVASEASQIIQALITGVRSGAKPSATLLAAAQRARLDLNALTDAFKAARPHRDESP